jgi:hypothetical protein
VQTVNVVVAEPPAASTTDDRPSVAVRPVGELEEVRDTVPLKLFTLVTVTVEVAHEPAGIPKLLGVAEMVKSELLETIV